MNVLSEIICLFMDPPVNGYQTGNQSLDDVITYGCHEGFSLVGPVTRTCQQNGTWTDDAPICEGNA